MPMESMPVLQVRFEGMRYSLMHVISEHHEEIEAEIERQLKEVLTPESIAAEIRKSLRPLFTQVLVEALKSAVHKALWSKEVKSLLETDTHIALLKVLKEYYPYSEQSPEQEV
jgi:hypothetical protein